jgi:hypothetical protein
MEFKKIEKEFFEYFEKLDVKDIIEHDGTICFHNNRIKDDILLFNGNIYEIEGKKDFNKAIKNFITHILVRDDKYFKKVYSTYLKDIEKKIFSNDIIFYPYKYHGRIFVRNSKDIYLNYTENEELRKLFLFTIINIEIKLF